MNENVKMTEGMPSEQPQSPAKKSLKKISVWKIVIYVFLGLFSLFCMFPLLYVVLLSFADNSDYMQATFLVIPKGFHFENYKAHFLMGMIPRAFAVSVLLVVVKTLYQMILTSLAAYAFTRKEVPGIRFFFTLFVIPMFFGGGLAPFYLTVYNTTGINNLACLIIPFGLSGFNMIVLRNFFSAIPESMIESCRIDGASDLRILVQFVLPLSGAGLATIALFYLVGTWNEWYWESLFLTSEELYPLALMLRYSLSGGLSSDRWQGNYDSSKTFSDGLNAAMTMIALLPILAIYPVLQKYFTKGVMVGSVKS